MIKIHKITGLKYLCYTQKIDHNSYIGSGKYWKRHLEKYGKDIETELLFETEDYEEFKNKAINVSDELNVVESDEWANLRKDDGIGGDTVSNKMWITDNIDEMYVEKDITLPVGWKRGRSPLKCKFKDTSFQTEMNSRVDVSARGKSIKAAWDEGRVKRDHSKCGNRGDANVAKRTDVRKKLSEAAKKREALKRLKKQGKENNTSKL